MNKVYKVKKNKFGNSVVTSELANNHSAISSRSVALAGMLAFSLMNTSFAQGELNLYNFNNGWNQVTVQPNTIYTGNLTITNFRTTGGALNATNGYDVLTNAGANISMSSSLNSQYAFSDRITAIYAVQGVSAPPEANQIVNLKGNVTATATGNLTVATAIFQRRHNRTDGGAGTIFTYDDSNGSVIASSSKDGAEGIFIESMNNTFSAEILAAKEISAFAGGTGRSVGLLFTQSNNSQTAGSMIDITVNNVEKISALNSGTGYSAGLLLAGFNNKLSMENIGLIEVSSKSTSTTDVSAGIRTRGYYSNVNAQFGNINASGTAHGIYINSETAVPAWYTGPVGADLNISGNINTTGANASGILVKAATGTVNVDIAKGSEISSVGNAINIETTTGAINLTNNGKITGNVLLARTGTNKGGSEINLNTGSEINGNLTINPGAGAINLNIEGKVGSITSTGTGEQNIKIEGNGASFGSLSVASKSVTTLSLDNATHTVTTNAGTITNLNSINLSNGSILTLEGKDVSLQVSNEISVNDTSSLVVKGLDGLNHHLLGAGQISVIGKGASASFNFDNSTGRDFSGTLNLQNVEYSLANGNNDIISNTKLVELGKDATLKFINNGGTSLKNLTLKDGSALAFDTSNVISITNLEFSGKNTIKLNPNKLGGNTESAGNLLDQQQGAEIQIINATNMTGFAEGNISLTDLSGDALNDEEGVDIFEGDDGVAKGIFNYSVGQNTTGIAVTAGLSELILEKDQTLHLDSTTATNKTLTAKVSGPGNLSLKSDDINGLTLDNVDNSYTGTTTVTAGTVTAGSDKAFGQTSALNINDGATVNLNGKTQTIGTLNNSGVFDFSGGTLTVTNGGFANKALGLVGDGTLNVTGGDLKLSLDNTQELYADIIIGEEGTISLINGGNAGNGKITVAGNLNVSAGDSGISNFLSGAGSVNVASGSIARVTGQNRNFTGTFNIADSATLAISGGTNKLGSGQVIFADNTSHLQIANTVGSLATGLNGTGQISLNAKTQLRLTKDNSTTFSGTFNIDGSSELITSNENQLGTSTITIAQNGNFEFDNYNGKVESTIKNAISGAGNVGLTNSNLLLNDTSNLSQVSGAINLKNGSNLTINNLSQINENSSINLQALTSNLNVNADSDITWDRNVMGIGSLNIDAASSTNAVNLTENATNGFTGTVHLTNSKFALAGTNTTALANSTLKIGSGNITTVSDTQQKVGNLAFDGGTLVFGTVNQGGERFASINTSILSSSADNKTNIQLNLKPKPSDNELEGLINSESNLLNHIGLNEEILITATDTKDLNANHLVLQNIQNGQDVGYGAGYLSAVNNAEGIKVADATYNYTLFVRKDKGLGVDYSLKQLDIEKDKTLILSANNAKNRTMQATIIGEGNLELLSDNEGITLENSDNSYTGVTNISSGLVIAGSDNAFGQTSSLNINSAGNGGSVNLNGMSQEVGSLINEGELNFNGGSLTITKGGYSNHAEGLTGSGSLLVTGGDFKISDTNENLSLGIDIKGGSLSISNAGNIGSSTVNVQKDGALNLGASNTVDNTLSGDGSVNINADVALTGTNSNFTGNFNITDQHNLTINSQASIGSGQINLLGEESILSLENIHGQDNASEIIGNQIAGEGYIDIRSSDVTFTADNSNFSGEIYIGNFSGEIYIGNLQGQTEPSNLNISNNNQLGGGSVDIVSGSSLSFVDYAQSSLQNALSGEGNINLSNSDLALTVTNNLSNVSGGISIDGTSNLSVSASEQLNASSALLGSGSISINTGSENSFNFGNGIGSAFTGTVNLENTQFDLVGNNAVAVTKATVVTNSGATLSVDTAEKAVGHVNLNGGTVKFDSNGSIVTNTLSTSTEGDNKTNIQINVEALSSTSPNSSNLFDQEKGNNYQLITAIDNSELVLDKLVLQDQTGAVIDSENGTVIAINQGVEPDHVADGTYNYVLNNKDGLGISYGLSKLNILDTKTLELNVNGATNTNMTTLITGDGNLSLVSNSGGLTLSNQNTYKGETTVSGGLVTLGSDSAFGETSALNINAGASVNLNGKTQAIGSLDNDGTLNIAEGNLTITNGGSSNSENSLSGSGTLNLTGGELEVLHANTDLSANIQIGNGAILTLGNAAELRDVANLGSSTIDIAQGGKFNINDGETNLANVLSGAGDININRYVSLTGQNSEFTGLFNIANGQQLTIVTPNSLGQGTVNLVSSESTINFSASEDTVENDFQGIGIINVINNSNITLSGNNTMTDGMIHIGSTGETVDNSSLTISSDANIGNANIINVVGSSLIFDHYNQGAVTQLNNLIESAGAINLVGTQLSLNDTYSLSASKGSVNITENSNLLVTGNNQLGTTAVNIAVNIAEQGDQLTINTTGAFSLNNAITGNGSLNVNTGVGNAFSFGTTAGSAFAGNVNLGNSTFDLSGNNTTALTNATLVIGQGNVTTASAIQQNVGNLTFDGGTLVFATVNQGKERFGSINTGTLTSSSDKKTNIQLNLGNAPADKSAFDPASNLLNHTGQNLEVLVTGTNTENFDVNDLVLQNIQNGQVVEIEDYVTQIRDVDNSNIIVADATYNYHLLTTDEDDLALDYSLTQLDIKDEQTLVLSANGADNRTMQATIVGTGNLELRSDDRGITLQDSNNSYSGTTLVKVGLVIAGSDNAFGKTSKLDISESATVNLNGKTQETAITTLDNKGTLNLAGGNLTINSVANTSNGVINVNNGTLNIDSEGSLTLNNTLKGAGSINVDTKGAAFTLGGNAGSAFEGTVNLGNSSFDISGSNATSLSNGTLSLGYTSIVTISGKDETTGKLEFNGGTLIVSGDENLFVKDVSVLPPTTTLETSGFIQTDVSELPPATALGEFDILQPGNADGVKKLVTITENTGGISNLGRLVLIDGQGNQITQSDTREVQQGGKDVADAIYDYKLIAIPGADGTAAIGLGIGYGLTSFIIRDGADFVIETKPGDSHNLDTEISGNGNLIIKSDNQPGLTISNSNNNFNGNTTIDSGTVISDADNALGNGKGDLIINKDGTLDLNGKKQDSNNVNNNGNLDINGGELHASGDLNNKGQLDIDNGGQIDVTGDINNLENGVIDLGTGSTIIGDGNLNNNNIINLGTDGKINIAGDINNNVSGVINLGDNGLLSSGGSTTNNGMLNGTGKVDSIFDNYGTVQVSNKSDGSSGSITFDKGLNNHNTINISNTESNTVGNQLIVNGDYTGYDKSAVYMNVDLGSDTSSRVDQMIVTGHAGGSTVLHLHDIGNVAGAETSRLGVKLIDVGTSSSDAFTLDSPIRKGIYEYTLHRNEADQDWYMTSFGSGNSDSDIRSDVGNVFGTIGGIINTLVPGYGNSATTGGMPGGLGGLSSLDRLMTADGRYLGSVWSSNTAAKNKGRALNGQINFSTDTYSTVLGADTGFTSGQNLWVVGGMLGLGTTKTDSTNRKGEISKTKSDTTSSTFGIYGTWYFDYQNVLSPYVGFSTSYTKLDNTIKMSGASNYKYDSHAVVVTANGGYPFLIDSNLVLEPQGQLSYVNYKSKDYKDNAGTNIKEKVDGNMIYRAGLFIYPKEGDFKPFAGVNIWYNSVRSEVSYDGALLKSDKVGFSYEAKVGFNYQATENFSISTELNYQQGKSHKRDYNANVGLKYQF